MSLTEDAASEGHGRARRVGEDGGMSGPAREGNGPGSSAVTLRHTSEPATMTTRHYPVDIPDISFRHYDRQKLGAREIMVHRVMSYFMNPKAHAARTAASPAADASHQVREDLRVLDKMMFTSYITSGRQSDEYLKLVLEGGLPERLGEQLTVLETVQQHYLEVDDLPMRVWLKHLRMPRLPTRPSSTAHSTPAAGTRAAVVHFVTEKVRRQQAWENKVWTEEDTEHMRSLKAQAATYHRHPLYDGESVLPRLLQYIQGDNNKNQGARPKLNLSHWLINNPDKKGMYLPSWPDKGHCPRFILQPVWENCTQMKQPWRLEMCPLLDLSLPRSRGRKMGAVWATAVGTGAPGPSRDAESARGSSQAVQDRGRMKVRYADLRRRSTSEPPAGAFITAAIPACRGPDGYPFLRLQITCLALTLKQMDARSRSRSLSRSRISDMFDWNADVEKAFEPFGADSDAEMHSANGGGARAKLPTPLGYLQQRKRRKRYPPCPNCTRTSHGARRCPLPCGHCGAPSPHAPASSASEDPWAPVPGVHGHPHSAPFCPVARSNRCKCVAFPTFHAADRCTIPCRRKCGNDGRPPGSFGHKSAMTCAARCCMCGLPGHSGRQCRWARCRCGGQHLGQDCRWKVECVMKGCSRYLCGKHCQECGSLERPFADRKCATCWDATNAAGLLQSRPDNDLAAAVPTGSANRIAPVYHETPSSSENMLVPARDSNHACEEPYHSVQQDSPQHASGYASQASSLQPAASDETVTTVTVSNREKRRERGRARAQKRAARKAEKVETGQHEA